jgi:hypothetical protein
MHENATIRGYFDVRQERSLPFLTEQDSYRDNNRTTLPPFNVKDPQQSTRCILPIPNSDACTFDDDGDNV